MPHNLEREVLVTLDETARARGGMAPAEQVRATLGIDPDEADAVAAVGCTLELLSCRGLVYGRPADGGVRYGLVSSWLRGFEEAMKAVREAARERERKLAGAQR